jgi:hypothetical protein
MKKVRKSEIQTNFEKAKLIIGAIVGAVTNEDNIQMYLVREFFKAFNKDQKDLAYNIINEGFNQNLIAGYKYLECCKLTGHRGEFFEIATANPLINL